MKSKRIFYLLFTIQFIFFNICNILFGVLSLNSTIFLTSLFGIFCIFVTYDLNKSLNNWLLIFFVTYFLFYFLGGFLGKLFIDSKESYVDLPTNFNIGISVYSEFLAYNYSSLVILVLLFISLFFKTSNQSLVPPLKHDVFLFNFSVFILFLSIPLVLLNSFFELKYYVNQGFAFYYTKDFRFSSPIPFISFFYNIYLFGTFIFLLSKPKEKEFNIFLVFFLLISLFESLRGTRSVIIINVIFIIWYRADNFKKDKIHYKTLFSSFFVFVFFLAFTGVIRQNQDVFTSQDVYNLILKGISTAQYQLALFIENSNLLKEDYYYILYPVVFPFYYLLWGDEIAYQSYERTLLPMDINHTLSSELNFQAYLAGAANGNNFVMEIILNDFYVFWIFLFFVLNYFLFLNRNSNIFLYLLSMVFIKHLIAAPRDSVFPNLWFVLKVFLFLVLVLLLKKFLMFIFNSNNK